MHDIDVIINDPEVQIVVEVMGGCRTGVYICKTVSGSGKERGDIQQSACGKAWRDSSVYRKRAGDQFPV